VFGTKCSWSVPNSTQIDSGVVKIRFQQSKWPLFLATLYASIYGQHSRAWTIGPRQHCSSVTARNCTVCFTGAVPEVNVRGLLPLTKVKHFIEEKQDKFYS